MVCWVEVRPTERGGGACAEIEPLLMMRPPRGLCAFMILMASCVHRKGPVRLDITTVCQVSNGRSSNGTGGAPPPALLNTRSRRPNFSLVRADRPWIDSPFAPSRGTARALGELFPAPLP